MNGLKMVNEQLEVVSRHADWSNHGDLMAGVDAGIEELNFQIKTVIKLREGLGELDDNIFRRVTSGVASPSPEAAQLEEQTVKLFAVVAGALAERAQSWVLKGFKIEGLSRIREIATNPGTGLHLLEIAKFVRESNDNRETDFGDGVYDNLAKLRKQHPLVTRD